MITITVKNVQLQFDADQITSGGDISQAEQAIELINLQLQREPYGLAAQILNGTIEKDDISIEEIEESEDTN